MYPPSGSHSHTYAEDMVVVRTRMQWVLLVMFLVLFLALPQLLSGELTRMVIRVMLVIISIHGLNILTGYCGQINLGQGGFMLLGGWISGMLTYFAGWNFWLALLCAGLGTAIVGIIFGIPSARVKGLYLALTTFAAQILITWVVTYHTPGGIGGSGFGIPYPQIGSIVFDTPLKAFYLIATFCLVFTYISKSIARSALGRAFVAIRDNDKAAEAIGINIFYYKLVAFAICTFYAGIAGSLYAHYLGWIMATSFTFMDSVWFVGMLIVGGMGTTVGPIFGVIFLTILDWGMRTLSPMIATTFLPTGAGPGFAVIAFGVTLLLFLIFEPRGLAHRWEIIKSSGRLWPFAY